VYIPLDPLYNSYMLRGKRNDGRQAITLPSRARADAWEFLRILA